MGLAPIPNPYERSVGSCAITAIKATPMKVLRGGFELPSKYVLPIPPVRRRSVLAPADWVDPNTETGSRTSQPGGLNARQAVCWLSYFMRYSVVKDLRQGRSRNQERTVSARHLPLNTTDVSTWSRTSTLSSRGRTRRASSYAILFLRLKSNILVAKPFLNLTASNTFCFISSLWSVVSELNGTLRLFRPTCVPPTPTTVLKSRNSLRPKKKGELFSSPLDPVWIFIPWV